MIRRNEPPGFPWCKRCPYRGDRGSPAVCGPCVGQVIRTVPRRRCKVCSQATDEAGSCRNALCASTERVIDRIHAIGVLSGELDTRIRRLKYHGARGWARVFGRVVMHWLDSRTGLPYDMVVANPTYLGPTTERTFGHTEAVLEVAADEDPVDWWGVRPQALYRTGQTKRSAGRPSIQKRAAALELRRLLRASDSARLRNRKILVFDDVCTTGYQLNAVAQFLLEDCGAASVGGLVLARAPWRGQ